MFYLQKNKSILAFSGILLIGCFLRLKNLYIVEPWGDEIATWYFSQNLGEVFSHESHTPLYYFLVKAWSFFLGTDIYVIRLFSVASGLLCLGGVSYLFGKKHTPLQGLYLFSVIWLWPTSVMYDRQARHYSLYLGMTYLLIILWERRNSIKLTWLWIFIALYTSLHPVAVLPVIFLLLESLYKEKNLKLLLIWGSALFPLGGYYLSRYYIQGIEDVLIHISWIQNSFFQFLKSLILLFSGDSFPFKVFYPITRYDFLIFAAIIAVGFLQRHLFRANLRFIFLFGFSLLIEEILFLAGLNLRINRFYIYLIPFFVMGNLRIMSSEAIPKVSLRSMVLVTGLMIYNVFLLAPWRTYEWDGSAVKKVREVVPSDNLVVCATRYQLKFYFDDKISNTCHDLENIVTNYSQGFFVFDINDSYRTYILSFKKDFRVRQKSYGNSVLYEFNPRR